MKSYWKKVFSSNHEYKVSIVEQILIENGIASVRINKMDSVYVLGQIEVLVSQEDVLEAINRINKEIRFE